jgi:hypothetical protein
LMPTEPPLRAQRVVAIPATAPSSVQAHVIQAEDLFNDN